MAFLKYLGMTLLGVFMGAWVMSMTVAANSFDVPTVFGKVTCFKLK